MSESRGKGKTKDTKDDEKDNKDKDENNDKEKQEKEKDQIKEDSRDNDKAKLKEKDNEKDKDDRSGVLSHLVDAVGRKGRERGSSTFSEDFKIYKGSYVSLGSPEIITISLKTGEINRYRHLAKDDQIGTQRVYKKTSPNSLLTLYLPSRELVSTGTQPAILKGILHADPKSVQGYRVYAQLTLTFRYGREDEEVMGLRFCNEAIMCLHQLWPQNEEIPKETLTPLQEALIKRLGDGAYPFTLSLTPQAPPSVQLVPAKRYYGAPIGTSYEVRCFIADRTDEKFYRRATVRMGVRVIHRTDVFSSPCGPENFASIVNNQLSPPPHDQIITKQQSEPIPSSINLENSNNAQKTTAFSEPKISSSSSPTTIAVDNNNSSTTATTTSIIPSKYKKSERVDSFSKIRLSPKSFRFSGRFGRSKSEAEKAPNDPFYSYSKSFQEVGTYESCGGPQGSVDKPFLLQEGRVGLKASLDKAWYTHGEDVIVTINIKNDSRKTVRKVRICAIQHVDVCMFNNGKFKNVVADADITSPGERTVGPGGSLNATVILKPQRGPTKNWIALEDSLQRSCEPDEIIGVIAASAVRTPTIYSSSSSSNGGSSNVGGGGNSGIGALSNLTNSGTSASDDRNVFAIYVSYYVKVKLTLSGMGGELSLKLPFALVHIDSSKNQQQDDKLIESSSNRLSIIDNENKSTAVITTTTSTVSNDISSNTSTTTKLDNGQQQQQIKNSSPSYDCNGSNVLDKFDKIETIEDDTQIHHNSNLNKTTTKRRLMRHETLAKDDSSDEGEKDDVQTMNIEQTPIHLQNHRNRTISDDMKDDDDDSIIDDIRKRDLQTSSTLQQTTCVQVHTTSSS